MPSDRRKTRSLEDAAQAEPPFAVIIVSGGTANVDDPDCCARNHCDTAIPGLREVDVYRIQVLIDLAPFHESNRVKALSDKRVEAEKLAFVPTLEEPVLIAE